MLDINDFPTIVLLERDVVSKYTLSFAFHEFSTIQLETEGCICVLSPQTLCELKVGALIGHFVLSLCTDSTQSSPNLPAYNS